MFDIPNASCIYDFGVYGPSQALVNKSWARMIDKARYGPASLGETIAQNGQAFRMIADRFGSMYRSYRALRRGHFRAFLRSLSMGPKRRHRNWVRNAVNEASGLWLEYYFGWLPLVGDVYDAVSTLSKPLPEGQAFRGSAGMNKYVSIYNYPDHKWNWAAVDVVTQGGRFSISNPNLYLLQQVGLANPAQLAWELLPFSFLVDWVFDVGSFIGGYSDLLGIKVTQPYTSKFRRAVEFHSMGYPPNSRSQTLKAWRVKRETSLTKPLPNLSVFQNLGTSKKRAATAASLLGQILTQ